MNITFSDWKNFDRGNKTLIEWLDYTADAEVTTKFMILVSRVAARLGKNEEIEVGWQGIGSVAYIHVHDRSLLNKLEMVDRPAAFLFSVRYIMGNGELATKDGICGHIRGAKWMRMAGELKLDTEMFHQHKGFRPKKSSTKPLTKAIY